VLQLLRLRRFKARLDRFRVVKHWNTDVQGVLSEGLANSEGYGASPPLRNSWIPLTR
jgi:hypothetical protein